MVKFLERTGGLTKKLTTLILFFQAFDDSKFLEKTKDGDKYRATFFLGYRTQKSKLDGKKAVGIYFSRLKCNNCDRIFRSE